MDHLSFKMAPRRAPKPPALPPGMVWFYLILLALAAWAAVLLIGIAVFRA